MSMNYRAFHKLSYGLYIIASEFEGNKAGYIANTAFQVTSSPPQIAISCHKDNYTAGIIRKSYVFSVSVLKKELNTSIIGEFGFMSSPDLNKFRSINYKTGITGAPVVTEASIAWLDCKVKTIVDVGSHVLIIGEVVDSEIISDEEPLTYDYYREKYKMLAPKNAPTYIEKEKLDSEDSSNIAEKPVENEPESDKVQETSDEHICTICGFVYKEEEGDPTMGIPPGTPFEDLPDDYKCPICNAGKDYFNAV